MYAWQRMIYCVARRNIAYYTAALQHYTKSPFFSSFSHNREMVSAHTHQRDCTLILRSRNYSAQSRDSENVQCNLEIAQLLRLYGTYPWTTKSDIKLRFLSCSYPTCTPRQRSERWATNKISYRSWQSPNWFSLSQGWTKLEHRLLQSFHAWAEKPEAKLGPCAWIEKKRGCV